MFLPLTCLPFYHYKTIIIYYPNVTVMHRLAIGGESPTSTIQHEYIWHRIVSPIFNFNFIDKSYMLHQVVFVFKMLGHTMFLHQLHQLCVRIV